MRYAILSHGDVDSTQSVGRGASRFPRTGPHRSAPGVAVDKCGEGGFLGRTFYVQKGWQSTAVDLGFQLAELGNDISAPSFDVPKAHFEIPNLGIELPYGLGIRLDGRQHCGFICHTLIPSKMINEKDCVNWVDSLWPRIWLHDGTFALLHRPGIGEVREGSRRR